MNKKENLLYSVFYVSSEQQIKIKESKKKKRRLFRSWLRTKKVVEHEGDSGTNCNRRVLNTPQRLGSGTERFGNRRTNRDHPNYSIVKIGQNTEKCPGDLRILARTPVEHHQLTLGWKTWKKYYNDCRTMIPILVGDIGTVLKKLEKRPDGLEVRIETIQTTTLHKSDRILRRVL